MPQGEPAGSDPEEHKICGPAEIPQPPEEYKKWKEQLPEATRKDLEEYFEALANSKQAKPRIKRAKKGGGGVDRRLSIGLQSLRTRVYISP